MKIAQVTATFPPYFGGTGNVCYHNSIELAKRGHSVTVFTYGTHSNHKYIDNIFVEYMKPAFKFGNAPFLSGLAELTDFDLIHLHYPFFFGSELIYLVSKLKKIKYIITYHNDVLSSGIIGLFFKIHNATFMKLIINNASAICVTSLDYAQNSFIKDVVKNDPKRIFEIHNGVDIDKFNPNVNGDIIKERHGIASKKIILFVGALDTPHFFKGVDFLLESFSKIVDDNVRLVIVGDGDLKSHYINIAKQKGLEDRTIFAGRVSNEDLPEYYAACDLVVLPSITMGEAFGMVLIEAMATGKPVISSNMPGIRTVIEDNKNGFLVEPKNVDALSSKIQFLLDNDSLCKNFGINGRRKVEEKYSWNIIGKKLDEVLINIVNSTR